MSRTPNFSLFPSDSEIATVPPEVQPFFDMLLRHFKRAEPNLQGPLAMEDSVRMQLDVIDKLDESLSGSFVSHHGNKHWF